VNSAVFTFVNGILLKPTPAIGLYGVMSYAVVNRCQVSGVRFQFLLQPET
jgi:hypothetical protein